MFLSERFEEILCTNLTTDYTLELEILNEQLIEIIKDKVLVNEYSCKNAANMLIQVQKEWEKQWDISDNEIIKHCFGRYFFVKTLFNKENVKLDKSVKIACDYFSEKTKGKYNTIINN